MTGVIVLTLCAGLLWALLCWLLTRATTTSVAPIIDRAASAPRSRCPQEVFDVPMLASKWFILER